MDAVFQPIDRCEEDTSRDNQTNKREEIDNFEETEKSKQPGTGSERDAAEQTHTQTLAHIKPVYF